MQQSSSLRKICVLCFLAICETGLAQTSAVQSLSESNLPVPPAINSSVNPPVQPVASPAAPLVPPTTPAIKSAPLPPPTQYKPATISTVGETQNVPRQSPSTTQQPTAPTQAVQNPQPPIQNAQPTQNIPVAPTPIKQIPQKPVTPANLALEEDLQAEPPRTKPPEILQDSKKDPIQDAKEMKSLEDHFRSLEYPELQVVPRASERLLLVAKEEQESGWRNQWQLWLPGLTTVAVASMNKGKLREELDDNQKRDANQILMAGQAIGAGWFLAGFWMTLNNPYQSGLKKLQTLPKSKEKRMELLRERLAEEALEKPTSGMRALIWISSLSMFLANGAQITAANSEGRLYAISNGLLSLVPLFFIHPTEAIYQRHLDYKKQIYLPTVSSWISPTSPRGEMAPQATASLNNWTYNTQLTWNF